MDFLPDVWVACEECHATGFGPDVLACTIDGRSIADVLAMTGEEYLEEVRRSALRQAQGVVSLSNHEGPEVRRSAGPAFAQGASAGKPKGAGDADQDIVRRLGVLAEVGLGYVRLGQPARTLSGGERQRLLLASALVDRAAGPTLYLFDEPTTGLHADDVAQLLRVFDHLIDAGHSLVVVEHNLDLVAAADWVIDLGPEGGNAGGCLVAAGPPVAIAATPGSYTGQALMAERNHHG
jgi:excinuclease ABC subunit A